jgi:hypothetical protein
MFSKWLQAESCHPPLIAGCRKSLRRRTKRLMPGAQRPLRHTWDTLSGAFHIFDLEGILLGIVGW